MHWKRKTMDLSVREHYHLESKHHLPNSIRKEWYCKVSVHNVLSLVKNHPKITLMPVQSWNWEEICHFDKVKYKLQGYKRKKKGKLKIRVNFVIGGWVSISPSSVFLASSFPTLISILFVLFALCVLAGTRYRSRNFLIAISSPLWLPIFVVLCFLNLGELMRTSKEKRRQRAITAENLVDFATEEMCMLK